MAAVMASRMLYASYDRLAERLQQSLTQSTWKGKFVSNTFSRRHVVPWGFVEQSTVRNAVSAQYRTPHKHNHKELAAHATRLQTNMNDLTKTEANLQQFAHASAVAYKTFAEAWCAGERIRRKDYATKPFAEFVTSMRRDCYGSRKLKPRLRVCTSPQLNCSVWGTT